MMLRRSWKWPIKEGKSPYATALADLEAKGLSKDTTKDAKIAAIAAAQARLATAKTALEKFPAKDIKL